MENYTIIAILVILAVLALAYTIRHFARRGGCCGGGDYRPRRKRLARVLYVKHFKVDGMHCAHCKARVEEAINDIRGAAAKVDLKKGEVTVSYAEVIPDETIMAKIERAGYHIAAKQ